MNTQRTFTLEELASLTGCQLIGVGSHIITGVADLEMAHSHDASFYSNPRYLQAMIHSQAGVIFIDEKTARVEGKNYLVTAQPSRAFQQLIDILYPPRKHPSGFQGIHPTAVIHETAGLGKGVTIGPHAVVDEGVQIGAGSFIGAGAYIGPETILGTACMIHPRVVIREKCIIGNRVIIQPGAVIGSCGFGYITDEQGRHVKLNQVGNVEIQDDVEIGANATIDRARFKSTLVGSGTKIDNLVQLGHGVKLGAGNIIVAQTGIAGSTTTGKYVVLAGQVAVDGHLHLDDEVMVAGRGGVTKSLSKGKYGGFPAIPLQEYNRNQVYLRHIEQYVNELKALKNQLKDKKNE